MLEEITRMGMEGGGEGNPAIVKQPTSTAQLSSQDAQTKDGSEQPSKCPPGMDLILGTESIAVQQQVEEIVVLSNYRRNKKYRILDSIGKPIFYAIELTGSCARCCLRCGRSFTFIVLNDKVAKVLRIERTCSSGCCFGLGLCHNVVKISTEQGDQLGKISQHCSYFSPSFTIDDAEGKERLKMKSPCVFSMCCLAKLEIQTEGGKHVGELANEWGGFGREKLTKVNNFGATFPRDLDPLDKTLLIAAVLLVASFQKYNQAKSCKIKLNLNGHKNEFCMMYRIHCLLKEVSRRDGSLFTSHQPKQDVVLIETTNAINLANLK